MSMGNDSTRTLKVWRKDIKESGMWSGMTLLLSIKDKPKSIVQILNKENFVLLNYTLACFS